MSDRTGGGPLVEALSPVEKPDTRSVHPTAEPGRALCLSGGGYRAMLFHLGALWRLNEVGYLPTLERISSVSGGSITAALLGLKWRSLGFDGARVAQAFHAHVVEPIRALAGKTIDVKAILAGVLGPGSTADRLADAYREHLFGEATLQDLPDDPPRFVINAANLQSGALWRFMKPYMRDYRVGEIRNPTLELARAVAASSAFPPFLSPLSLKLEASDYSSPAGEDLHREPFTTDVVLSDGGIYDNLGLETVWKRYRTILVSDAGKSLRVEERPRRDWARHGLRVVDFIKDQVRVLRTRQVIASFGLHAREGTYWGIRTDIRDYGLADALPCPFDQSTALAMIPTRLRHLPPIIQERLINWGYAVSDAALRKYVDRALPAPGRFPYPRAGIG